MTTKEKRHSTCLLKNEWVVESGKREEIISDRRMSIPRNGKGPEHFNLA